MTNPVHLMGDPGEQAENLALLMKWVAGRQTRDVHRRGGRHGTLWEGRYQSSPIEEDRSLLACCRSVERNPVRAGLVEAPEPYPWSSFRQEAGLAPMAWLDSDPC